MTVILFYMVLVHLFFMWVVKGNAFRFIFVIIVIAKAEAGRNNLRVCDKSTATYVLEIYWPMYL